MDVENKQMNIFNLEKFQSDFDGFTKMVPGIVSLTAPDGEMKALQIQAFLNFVAMIYSLVCCWRVKSVRQKNINELCSNRIRFRIVL